ncbi:MAG: type II toxin-antitoxin system Phd/YefM family antitoxin [Nocardiopsaceae bacterium]|nr:type II toxin-antitoxin system Phd/YefM family antitoxin [Nocardiopsaceae bacterium]
MTILPLAEARIQFSKLVESAVKTHDRIRVTRNGIPAAVILSDDDYEGMRATIETLADSEEMTAIAEGIADLRAGRKVGQDEMAEIMRRAGRA